MIRSRVGKLNKIGVEKTLDGKRWVAQEQVSLFSLSSLQCGPRLGSINANDGGWVNGKRSAGRVVDAPEPPIKFTIPKCESLNVGTTGFKSLIVQWTYLAVIQCNIHL